MNSLNVIAEKTFPSAKENRQQIFIEISGTCNAKCPWCVTGSKGHLCGPMMPLEKFQQCIERLKELGAVDHGQDIFLYNWGEPTLNTQLDEMLKYLAEKKLRGYISTNGIKSYLPRADAARGMSGIVFSVSGVIDSSGMRIHGYPATLILQNIDHMMRHLQRLGWKGQATMAFHIYQHNLGEVVSACDWCAERGIVFSPSFAYINDFHMAESYLNHTLDRKVLQKAAEELFLYYVRDLIASMPKGWPCSLRSDQLVIDESCNVLTCCALPRGHEECVIGSVFDVNLEDIENTKARRRVCASCESSGLAWWGTHPQGQELFKEAIYNHRLRMRLRKMMPLSIRKLISMLIGK